MKDKNLPDYIKYFDNTYIEGWGLYSENLFDYKNKGEYYFSLNYQILRSARLILIQAYIIMVGHMINVLNL